MKPATALALALACAACASPPEQGACDDVRAVTVAGVRDASGAWVVGGWASGRAHYPAFTTLSVPHGLGREPTSVECWASFTADGALAQQIGNVCQVLPNCAGRVGVTATEILVRNSGAQDFWLRLVIR